jgi:hypothetical protein
LKVARKIRGTCRFFTNPDVIPVTKSDHVERITP